MLLTWSVGLSIAAVFIWAVIIFNALVRDKNRVLAAWSDIDVQLKRRHDLIPKLVAAVQQYADYEQATLAGVTALRQQAESVDGVGALGAVESAIGSEVRKLIAVAEHYPDLKASLSFLELQKNISDVEDHIQMARRYYNGAVRALNTRIDSFPDLLIARLFAIHYRELFELEESDGLA